MGNLSFALILGAALFVIGMRRPISWANQSVADPEVVHDFEDRAKALGSKRMRYAATQNMAMNALPKQEKVSAPVH